MIEYREYPRMLYHRDLGVTVVNTPEEMVGRIANGWDLERVEAAAAVDDLSDLEPSVMDPWPNVVEDPIAMGIAPESLVVDPTPKSTGVAESPIHVTQTEIPPDPPVKKSGARTRKYTVR